MIEHIKRGAPLSFYASARLLGKRERETFVSSSFSSSKERRARKREREIFFRSLRFKVEFFVLILSPRRPLLRREEEGKDYYDGDGDIALVDVIFALVFSLGDEFRVLDVVVVVQTRRANDAI